MPAIAAAPLTVSGPARVIDGDTVVVAGTVVRLKGVDAPELGSVRGEIARGVMIALVTSELTCRLTGERTPSPRGRLLRHRRRRRPQPSDHRIGGGAGVSAF
jgi:endonuclease YncB( thermonuclease family)